MRRAVALFRVGAAALLLAACASHRTAAVTPLGGPGVDLTRPPVLGPPPSLTLPPVVTRDLANGLRLVIVEQHELPVVDLVLLVRTGGEGDPPGKSGLATLTAEMLLEGTTTRSSLQIADQEAFLGARLGAASGWDESSVTLHSPTAHLDSALALFADVALHPSFPERELVRLKKERLTELVEIKDRPPEIASRAYATILFGAGHPYGHPLAGTETSVTALRRADAREFYDGYFRPNNAALIVVGDVTANDIARRLGALFAAWRRGMIPAVVFSEPPRVSSTTVYLIDKPGAPQTSVRIGGIGAPRSTRDYFAIQVMNSILGGSFTSRLNQNLRETHGYTYGAGSRFDMRRVPGPFTARAEVVATKTDSALLEFMKELRTIRDTVATAELAKAKRFLQLQLPAEFETTSDIARQLIPLVLYGLPLDFYNSYVERIDAVTQADVQRVARQYVNPRAMIVVVVGDRASIEPQLRAIHLGEISIRDLEGEAR